MISATQILEYSFNCFYFMFLVTGLILPGVKRQGHESDSSPPSSVEIQDDGPIPSLPHTCSWLGT
jgi:hypothetical protein